MQPIGPLMWEHRLIERAIRLIALKSTDMEHEATIDPVFIDSMVDFIRTYADRTHHGKEEEILFKDLATKPLSPEHRKVMYELIEEHKTARATVKTLVEAKEEYLRGDATRLSVVMSSLKSLVDLYPRHIEKEDRHFFFPIMNYYSAQDQEAMLREFYAFDGKMIHKKYQNLVESLEQRGYTRKEHPGTPVELFVCEICGYIYDPALGDPEGGIQAGTPFDQVPNEWRCPICGAPKQRFYRK